MTHYLPLLILSLLAASPASAAKLSLLDNTLSPPLSAAPGALSILLVSIDEGGGSGGARSSPFRGCLLLSGGALSMVASMVVGTALDEEGYNGPGIAVFLVGFMVSGFVTIFGLVDLMVYLNGSGGEVVAAPPEARPVIRDRERTKVGTPLAAWSWTF